eukprot:CAMPEP_0196826332 /NCGR_PEP_ID=MMETSP1362-20130617/93572_1 /TAXON_ID=163516 /ORGANISM="Leptocylindrus danicus, Strain CCMP1856" /LENGTH=298 /DNA_ID=CAMNT_0042206899 /DNA_START=338 /DNA_END=1234 /DNA_ORIENTATION=+
MKTYDKLMVLLSLSDLLSSASYFCSTWPIPQGTSTIEGGATVYQAYGNKTTCDIQGFISQYATIIPLYNAMLALNYLLLVKFGVKDDEMKRKYEPFMLIVPFIVALSLAVTGLAYDMYGTIGFWCWLKSDETKRWRSYVFLLIPVWCVIVFVTVAMIMVYLKVRKQEDRMARYSLPGSQVSRSISKEVATQAIWYLAPFYLAWIPTTFFAAGKVTGILNKYLSTRDSGEKFIWFLWIVTFVPLQGFLNFLVYLRPRFLKWYKAKAKEKARRIVSQTNATRSSSVVERYTTNDEISAAV